MKILILILLIYPSLCFGSYRPSYDKKDLEHVYYLIDTHNHEGEDSSNIVNLSTITIKNEIFFSTSNRVYMPTANAKYAAIYATPTLNTSIAELFVLDGAGNETKISPHNSKGEWIFYSRNLKTGKVICINMEKAIRILEKISGEKLINYEK